jgi:hypothetical protein
MNLKILLNIVDLIKIENTGSPADLSRSVNISERMLYKYMEYLKHEFNAPVKYSRKRKTYYFNGNGSLNLRWQIK